MVGQLWSLSFSPERKVSHVRQEQHVALGSSQGSYPKRGEKPCLGPAKASQKGGLFVN